MPPRRRSTLLTTLAERVFRTRTVHDARRIGRAIRLLLSFGLLIVLPNLLLAYFALSSIQSSSASLESELAPRTDAIMDQVRDREREIFEDFEQKVGRRLVRNVKPVTGLAELSPHLLAAYVLDPSGRLLEPFDPPIAYDSIEETPAYRDAWRAGLRAERERRLSDAGAAYRAAVDLTTNERLRAQAALAAARVQVAQDGDTRAYADVIGDYGNTRDPRGFRIGDIARLNQAEFQAARQPDGAFALRELADTLIYDARWTLYEGGEPTVARRALKQLERPEYQEAVEQDWIDRARRRLEQRNSQLFWSGRLLDEMADVSAGAPSPEDGWLYLPSASSNALWAARNTGTSLVIYAFDREQIVEELGRTASRIVTPDPELVAAVGRIDTAPQGPTVFKRAFTKMPREGVWVAAANPERLEADRNNRIIGYLLIIFAVLATSVIGIFVTVRLVSRELEAARVKTDFAANVSHELRSPITQIRLKGEALQLDLVFDDDDRQAHYDAIVREAERLSRLVDNVLDFAAIERGAKKYTFRPEDLTGLIYSAVEADRARLEANGLTVEIDVPDDLPVVWMDREAISQVLINLLSNAAKYGADGKWVGVRARAEKDTVVVSVADRGMGISTEDQERVFEDFFRSTNPAVRRRKGTGIGLTIVRYIIEAHGGTITVASAPGKGATFTFHLPLEPPPGAGA